MADMKTTKNVLEFAIKSGLPVIIWGESGVGKTESANQITTMLKYNLVTLHLATQDVADLIGVPQAVEGKTVYARPSWLVDSKTDEKIADPSKPTVYFLDEFNRASRPVLACMLPFLLNGTIHEHKIGKKDCVIAACNFDDDDYDVTELSDKALRDRCGHIICRPTAAEFMTFAENKIDDVTWELLKSNPEIVAIKAKELEFQVDPSRRKIIQVTPYFKNATMAHMKAKGMAIMQAFLGESFTSVWMKNFKKRDRGLEIKEIMKMSKETKAKIKKMVSGNVRVDVLNVTNDRILKYFKKNEKKTLDDDQVENLFRYVYMLPSDMSRVLVEQMDKEIKTINKVPFGEYFWTVSEKNNWVDMIRKLVDSYQS